MADSILYNQEVTAEMLNDIAIDLGNTSFNGFGEEKFGADKLNEITSSLVSKGVLTSDNQCKPIVNGNYVSIQTGTIVFGNGAKKKITEVVNVEKKKGTYIYALNNVSAGICKITVSETDPATDATLSEDDYVAIAKISSGGSLTDKREFSAAKVKMPVANQYTEHEFSITFNSDANYFYPIGEIDVATPACIACYNGKYVILNEGEQSGVLIVSNESSQSAGIYFVRNGGIIKIYGQAYSSGNPYITFTILFA